MRARQSGEPQPVRQEDPGLHSGRSRGPSEPSLRPRARPAGPRDRAEGPCGPHDARRPVLRSLPRAPVPRVARFRADAEAARREPGFPSSGRAPLMSLLAAVCLLTFLHYVGAQMRGPILPLYAAAHGATATGVGFIVAAHMAVAAAGSIPLGRLSDVWGRRPLLLGGMLVSAVTSLFLPLFEGELALMTIYGLAHFGAIAVGPFLGGLAAQWWGYREAFVGSAIVVAAALVFGLALPAPAAPPGMSRQGATFADIRGNANVWAGWIVSVGGLTTQGVVFTFLS